MYINNEYPVESSTEISRPRLCYLRKDLEWSYILRPGKLWVHQLPNKQKSAEKRNNDTYPKRLHTVRTDSKINVKHFPRVLWIMPCNYSHSFRGQNRLGRLVRRKKSFNFNGAIFSAAAFICAINCDSLR